MVHVDTSFVRKSEIHQTCHNKFSTLVWRQWHLKVAALDERNLDCRVEPFLSLLWKVQARRICSGPASLAYLRSRGRGGRRRWAWSRRRCPSRCRRSASCWAGRSSWPQRPPGCRCGGSQGTWTWSTSWRTCGSGWRWDGRFRSGRCAHRERKRERVALLTNKYQSQSYFFLPVKAPNWWIFCLKSTKVLNLWTFCLKSLSKSDTDERFV